MAEPGNLLHWCLHDRVHYTNIGVFNRRHHSMAICKGHNEQNRFDGDPALLHLSHHVGRADGEGSRRITSYSSREAISHFQAWPILCWLATHGPGAEEQRAGALGPVFFPLRRYPAFLKRCLLCGENELP